MISTEEVSRIVLVQLDSNSSYERYNITQVKQFVEEGTSTIKFLCAFNAALDQFSSKSQETALTEDRHVDDNRTRLYVVTKEKMTTAESTNPDNKQFL